MPNALISSTCTKISTSAPEPQNVCEIYGQNNQNRQRICEHLPQEWDVGWWFSTQILSCLTVIYVDIINHLPACVNAGSTNSSMARDISSSSPSGLERFLVIALLVCVTAMEQGYKK